MVEVPVWDTGKGVQNAFFLVLDLFCARSFYSNKFASIEFCTVSKLRACVWVCMTRVTKVSQSSEMSKMVYQSVPHKLTHTIIINWTLLSMNNHPRKDDTHNTHTGKFPSYLKFYATNMPPSGWWGEFRGKRNRDRESSEMKNEQTEKPRALKKYLNSWDFKIKSQWICVHLLPLSFHLKPNEIHPSMVYRVYILPK